ncbi:MAG: SDR family NAD(P)-dependent oxidoreductase [Bryobacteraceae bacterium]
MEPELNGKSALITGASRGIGAATAIALARQGVRRFTLQYNGYREGAEETAAAVARLGAEAGIVQADLGEMAGIECLLSAIGGREYDILVNNAGSLVKRARLSEFTSDLFDRVMNLNVKSAWMITQAVAPGMIARRSGMIVFVSSIAARTGGGLGATIYSAAKAAISTITKGLAKELAPSGIRVNAVSPGTVNNNFHVQFSTQEILDNVVKATPAGRLGENEEVADTIVFLCSNAARFIHGQTIEINGGMFMV